MSSYRNYYSSRNDTTEPRFSSITPSTYRPSFSGGTYRIKRDPISTTPSYVSRYTTSNASSKDPIKDKLSESAKTTTSKTITSPSSSTTINKSQLSSAQRTYGSSTTTARDNTCNHSKPRYTTTNSSPSVSKYGIRSRDPSPANDRRAISNLTTSRIKSRDPSPSPSIIRGKSRDPSPAVDIKPKVGNYSSAYRLGSRTSSSGYSSHYGSNASLTKSNLPDKSISYLSCSEFSARTVSRAREIAERKSNENESKDERSSSTSNSCKTKNTLESCTKNDNAKTTNEQNNIVEAKENLEKNDFIAIEVVTRGTSPTPPNTTSTATATTVIRTRRIDPAKTIEKTIQRSKIKPQTADKEIQSDRLDDPTRYSRFGLSSRMSSYSPHSDRYSSTLRYTNSPLSNKSSRDTTSRSESESKKDDNTSKSSINKSNNTNTNTNSSSKVERSKNSPETKTKILPPKTTTQISMTKQKSSECVTSNLVGRSLPPLIPKGESPTKSSILSTSTSNIAKLPNKDFRKSALNVGPTDRPRKSRTPSVGTDNEDKTDTKSPTVNGTIQLLQRLERSPSIGSEAGNSSSSSSSSSRSNSSSSSSSCHSSSITNKNNKSRTSAKPNSKTLKKNIDEQSLISTDTSTNSNTSTTTGGGCVTGSYKKIEATATTATTTASAYSELDDSYKNNNRRIVTGMTEENKMSQQQLTAPNSRITNNKNAAVDVISSNTKAVTPTVTIARTLSSSLTTATTTTTASTSSPQPYKYHQINNSPATDSSSTFAKNTDNIDAKTFLIRKLESVSNFFAARQHDTNSEPMFLDTTSSSSQNNNSNSFSSDGRQVKQNTESESVLYTDLTVENPQTTATVTATITTSNPNTDTTSDPIDDSSWWLDTSRQINTESALDIKDEMKYRIRHIDSGETSWWMRNDDDDTLAEDLKTLNQDDPSEINDCSLLQNSGDSGNLEENSCWWGHDMTITGDSNDQFVNQMSKVEKAKSEEPPWWLNDDDNDQNENSSKIEKSWWENNENSNSENINNNVIISKSDSSNRLDKLNVTHVDSGEKAWWLDETNNSEQTKTTNEHVNNVNSNSDNSVTNNLSKTPSSDKPWWMSGPSKKLFNIRHVESGEKAWWMQENNDEESVCQIEVEKNNFEKTETVDKDSDNEHDNKDDDDDENRNDENDNDEIKNIQNRMYPNIIENLQSESMPPLGDRASPDGLEDPAKDRKSPYDNIPSTNDSRLENAHKLFISRHTNIDELLGGSCRPLSPIIDRLEGKNIFIEEITPEQVRIHDSRAQNAVIQRIERDEWDYQKISPPRNDPQKLELDDATLQVYKDGDYGAYLDLESSLAEQSEEVEGLHSSRKNSLVVRTQLSVRVHAIIEKLMSSEGSELRRALFSLKQIFQEDKDLVHGFVALGGLNCLVCVGNGADQNYQNYILRALGQVMLYVDGMNGVMKHAPTVQWLYSLIASKYRLVVKTALKLLLVFVEYVETNCSLLVNAIHVVDFAQGNVPWTNIMKLLKDYENADTELLIYATSLINKTLSGLNDQDSFYDESDLLEQQGMEGVIQRYMSRPGTDLDLLDQLQLYEAVLKFEDGEADGIRLPHNSVRKTLRYSSSKADSTERRKSRRHSTGTSPAGNKILSSPKRLMPKSPGGPLDEDSSSSSNSNEFGNGVFKDKGHREEAGVTPALRRRRERAERHKSFMREQQEAVANNGLMTAFEKREELGQIVTAVPVQLQNGNDSPPESLTISNETTPQLSPQSLQSQMASTQLAITNSINSNILNNNGEIKTIYCPTKCLLNSTTISVISNGFDRKLSNGNANSQISSTETRTNKNMMNKSNATAINGLIKNINRNDNENLTSPIHNNNNHHHNIQHNNINNNHNQNQNQNHNHSHMNHNNHHFNHNNNNTQYNSHKKFENNANRLNNYYTHLATPKPYGILCQKNLNNFENNNIILNKNRSSNNLNGTQINQKESSSNVTVNLPMSIKPEINLTPISNKSQELICCQPSITPQSLMSPPIQPTTPITPTTQITPTTPITPTTLINPITSIIPITPIIAIIPTQIESPTLQTPLPPDLISNLIPENKINENIVGRGDENGDYDEIGCGSSVIANKRIDSESLENNVIVPSTDTQIEESDNEDRKLLLQLKKDHTVKDLTQKLSNLPTSPTHEEKPQNRIGDMTMTGLISKAKEGLAKSKSKGEISRSPSVDQEIKKSEPKKSENELHWDELVKNMARPLTLCDLDFTDLHSDDEKDVLAPRGLGGGVPPPPPPLGMPKMMGCSPCPPPPSNLVPSLFNHSTVGSTINGDDSTSPSKIKKNKKTVKLFWKEVREDMIPVTIGKTIWDELPDANVDLQKLEHLFESRAKDIMTKKQHELNKSKEIIVLDHKRSNAINIAITKLPPPRAIKAAILKMDATVVTREGIDKLLNMLPTEEERSKIQEAQMSNPELPLGSAEQFLLTLASVSELSARLKLWAFKLDFENSEKEIAEPLMDLKQGIELLRQNRTFKCILSTLLSVGIFLNGAAVKGFQIEYLAKVPEVKDTVHKHSLLHHLCHMVMESSTDTTDLYSEIGPITRSSKADFTELAHNLVQLETECKASWDRLKLIAKHDCPPQMKQKLVDFLAECAERIILLQIVHRRVINRYRKFLLWLGIPQHSVAESRPNEFCRIVSEFALEYRTTRERVLQQIEKKANHRERNKTRGKMIIDVAKFRTQEDHADAALKELLGSPNPDSFNGTLTWRRRRAENLRSPIIKPNDEHFTDGDDEILESLVKTATKAPGARPTPRERKRTRHADRKSLRRTLKNGLTEEEKQHVSSLIKSY